MRISSFLGIVEGEIETAHPTVVLRSPSCQVASGSSFWSGPSTLSSNSCGVRTSSEAGAWAPEIPAESPRVDGKRTTVERFVLYTPGASHVKEMAAVMNQLNKLQVRVLPHTLLSYCTVLTVTALYLTLPYLTTTYYSQMGEWLLQYIESDETSCCYLG